MTDQDVYLTFIAGIEKAFTRCVEQKQGEKEFDIIHGKLMDIQRRFNLNSTDLPLVADKIFDLSEKILPHCSKAYMNKLFSNNEDSIGV